MRPVMAPPRAAQLRALAMALMLVLGLGAAALVALWEPVADFLGEGGVRFFEVTGGTRRALIAALLAAATLVAGHALWNWRGVARYSAAGAAGVVALLVAAPLALPAIACGVAMVAVEYIAPVDRERLSEVGPRAHPLSWAVGSVIAVAFLVVAGYLSWFLISPLIDEGTELDEALAFSLSTQPMATSTAAAGTSEVSPTPDSSEPAAGDAEQPVAMLVSSGELMGTDSFHFGSGDVLLIRDPNGDGLLRFEDYEVRNGPDIHVFLTPDAGGDVHVDGAVDLGAVRATRGNVNYELPAGTDLESFRSVVIYCVPFRVVFATAELN